MNAADAIVEIRTTFADRAAAAACADRLVGERLAACVQIDGPVTSTYRWRGVVEHAEEYRCACKTTPERADACMEAIARDHAYDTPELMRVVVTASPGYAAWVRASVADE